MGLKHGENRSCRTNQSIHSEHLPLQYINNYYLWRSRPNIQTQKCLLNTRLLEDLREGAEAGWKRQRVSRGILGLPIFKVSHLVFMQCHWKLRVANLHFTVRHVSSALVSMTSRGG